MRKRIKDKLKRAKILAALGLELKSPSVCSYEAALLPTAQPMHISVGVIGADALKGSQRLFDSEHKATEESGKQGTSDVETPNSACDDIQPGTSSVQISEHSEILHDEEINAEEAAVISYPDVNSLELGYESSMTAEHRLSMNAFAVSAQSIVFPAMTSSLYGGVVAFNEHTGQAQNLDISLTGSVFDPSLDAVQPMSYSTEEITTGSTPYIGDSAGQTIDCCLLQEGIENSSNYHSASVSSVSLNYNENLNPQAVIGYVDLNPVVVQQLNYPAVTTPGSVSHLDKAVIRGDEAATKSPTEVRSPVVVGEVLELAQQSEGKHESTDTNKQADTRKSSNDGLPPPNFIPYRMITVENSKPTEIITTDPSSDVSTSKPPPKRRRKYKYVVESVLDNVPYTFRQAESDDDESSEKPNAITK
ncbi:unnamed protein product [Heligmosomoides polygyrus]|uniref:BZIP domain-containing protein n=1 Tax=Heligmosomoides polygyrus TaxID=6339 RepID=A0A3P8A2Q0_HELPZ|nr:unnamed protein product [Heligmosomoides polygyrus]